jgi:hypothetical protein
MQSWRSLVNCIHPITSAHPPMGDSLPGRPPLCQKQEHIAYVSCDHMQLGRHGIDQVDHLPQRRIQQRLSYQLLEVSVGELLTDDKIWRKLVCDWHNDLLERIDVIAISKSTRRPSDIDRSIISLVYLWTGRGLTFPLLHHLLPCRLLQSRS